MKRRLSIRVLLPLSLLLATIPTNCAFVGAWLSSHHQQHKQQQHHQPLPYKRYQEKFLTNRIPCRRRTVSSYSRATRLSVGRDLLYHQQQQANNNYYNNNNNNNNTDPISAASFQAYDADWEHNIGTAYSPYRSKLLKHDDDWEQFLLGVANKRGNDGNGVVDPFWEQVRFEAKRAVRAQPEAGPQMYQGILSQPSLLVAIVTVVAHQLETELIPAVQLKNLFLSFLTVQDEYAIRLDLQAVATRSPSVENAVTALLFHNGFHALTAYRVGHRLWQAQRKSLAYYMQSVVSRKYSADIHPACVMGHGIYLRVGAGVVIGETAVVGNDVSILEGVTLGGTGKESGDRHPKVGNGVIIQDGGTVLGNIPVGDGAVVRAKSIVTKPVPALAIVSGIPGRVTEYRSLTAAAFDDDLQSHLWHKYIHEWKQILQDSAEGDYSSTTTENI